MLWVIDVLSIFFVVVFGFVTSFEDIKFNKIRNKWVLLAIISAFFLLALRVVVILLKGSLINPKYFTEFFLNFFITFIVGIFMWETRLWNPADAKLFLAYAALIPLSVYKWGYVNHFPAFTLLINTFIPCFVFYSGYLILKTSIKDKFLAIKEVLKPEFLINFMVFVFGFAWLIKIIFSFLGIKPNIFLTTILLFVPLILFDRVLKISHFKFGLALAVLRAIFDFKTLLELTFLINFLKIFLLFVFLRYFLLNLSFNFFTVPIHIKSLKPGMVLAENFYKEKGEFRKRKSFAVISFFSGLLRMIKEKPVFSHAPNGLTKEDVKKLKALYASGKIKDDTIKIYQTIPFAPFMFFGVVLTLLFKGNLLIGLKLLIEKFI